MTPCFTSAFRSSRCTLLLIMLLPVLCAYAQKSLSRSQFIRDSTEIMKPPFLKPQVRVDNRQVYYKQQTISMNGIDAGVMLKEKLRLTLGYHWLNDKLDFYRKITDSSRTDRQIKFKYVTLNSEFIYKSARYYSLGVLVEFGIGENELLYKDYITGKTYGPVEKGFVFITDFGLSGTFKPLHWLGIKGSVGYRKTLINGVKDFQFNGFFTSLGLNVDLFELGRDMRMLKLEKRYKHGNNLGNAVDLITE